MSKRLAKLSIFLLNVEKPGGDLVDKTLQMEQVFG